MPDCVTRFSKLSLKERYVFYNSNFSEESNVYSFLKAWQQFSPAQRDELSHSFSAQEKDWLKARTEEEITDINPEQASATFEKLLDALPGLWQEYQDKEAHAGEVLKMRHAWMRHEEPDVISDQSLGVKAPPAQKAVPEGASLIDLPALEEAKLSLPNIFSCIANRASRRKFSERELSLAELSYLLWSTQGIRKIVKEGERHLRMVPSGGARQPFESYLAVNQVTGLHPGIYRYLPFTHQLLCIKVEENLKEILSNLCYGQKFCGYCAVCFFWATIPYRTEWRYSYVSGKDILIEAGHVCQNLYLACESIGAGTCGIAAYDQPGIDALLGLDGEEEFVVYLAPVGFAVTED